MGFKAADSVEELTYDFSPHVDASGVIAEPTSNQIDTFRTEMAAAYQSLGLDPEVLKTLTGGGDGDMSAVLEHFGEIMTSTTEMEGLVAHAVVGLCGGSPTEGEIMALPFRVRQAFLGWMTGIFFSPEA